MQRAALLGLVALAACARARGPAVPLAPLATAFAIPEKTADPLAPLALDANDGSALEVRELTYAVQIHGPIAHTAVYARFVNPQARQIEGRFRMVLPPRSSISRLAMKVGSSWREADAAETSIARETYEEIQHRRRDPLLVEQPREREVAARIAPIEAFQEREVRLEYTSELDPSRPLVIPLRGLPVVGLLDVSIAEAAHHHVHVTTRDTRPDADVRFPVTTSSAARSGDLVATRVAADIADTTDPIEHAVYLVDTGASANLEAARAILAWLPRSPVIAYDQTAALLPNPDPDLRARGALGWSNLTVGLELAKQMGARRVVIIGGGELVTPVAGFERVDVLGPSASVDARVLGPVAKNGVVLEDAHLFGRAEVLRHLEHPVHGAAKISYTHDAGAGAAPDPVVEHAAAAAKVEALVLQGQLNGWSEAARREVTALARAHRLATPFTSLIVLENDLDVAHLHWNETRANDVPPSSPPRSSSAPRVKTKPPVVRQGMTTVTGRLPPEVIQRIVRLHAGAFKACHLDGQRRDPLLAGRVVVKFLIQRDGTVARAQDGGSEVRDPAVIECMVHAFSEIQFPPPEGGVVMVVYPFVLGRESAPPPPQSLNPHQGRHYSPFEDAFRAPRAPWSPAYTQMREDPSRAPRTPVGLVALGAALEARGQKEWAARAYASLVELWPERAELARAAAVRLDHLRPGDPLAIRLLRRAVADRPDQPSGHHLLGLTLLRAGDREGARAAWNAGLARRYELRYAGASDLLRSDLLLLEPSTTPVTRVSLAWETDTSDVDVVITNANGEHLGAMGVTYASDGYGPEAITAPPLDDLEVQVALHRRGMGGDVLGEVHVIKRDERGDVTVEPRPFEIMTEHSLLDLGRL